MKALLAALALVLAPNLSQAGTMRPGPLKYTVKLSPTACDVVPGNAGNADCIVKADPAVFENLVVHGKAPGALDIARGRFKTNDVALLMTLKDCFRP